MALAFVARHGETQWNLEGRYQGRLESELSPLGRRQAEALARALAGKPIRRVYTSPLARCAQTARPLAIALGVPLETDPLLLEIGHGSWEGRLRDEIAADEPELLRAWREAPQTVRFRGGESLEEVRERWRRFASKLPDEDVAVVTHDVLVRVAILEGSDRSLSRFWEPRVRNGAFARFSRESDAWYLIEECGDRHLAGILADESRQAL
ncbi:MAG TPA: histidine phosphatase family protein [Verrucomicrobiae bacterium]|nr:histidine phosphatase family protein [Verrucomicrobiae bacterium]